jgi:hypothetical protein
LFCIDVLQDIDVQRPLGYELLQAGVLMLQLPRLSAAWLGVSPPNRFRQ